MKINKLLNTYFGVCILLVSCNKSSTSDNNSTGNIESKTEKIIENTIKNEVETVKVKNQIWTLKNLDVTTFRNGDTIMKAETNEEWIRAGKLHIPAWCYYNNDSKYNKECGKLYNWFAVMDDRGLAPVGYHIPNETEFDILRINLGYNHYSNESQLHEADMALFSKLNVALSGYRLESGIFTGIAQEYSWWSVSKYVSPNKYNSIGFGDDGNQTNFIYNNNPGAGFSIRCIKGESDMGLAKIPVLDNELIEFDLNGKLKEGEEITYDIFGNKFIKHFKNGLEEGLRVNLYDNKLMSKGNYKNGLQHGDWEEFYYNDVVQVPLRVKCKGNYLKGKKNGEWITYDWKVINLEWIQQTGKVENYVNGLLEGKVLEYDSDNILRTKEIYNQGRKIHSFIYLSNGVLDSEEHIDSNGNLKEYIEYFSDGKVSRKSIYINGRLDSNIFYDKNGNIREN